MRKASAQEEISKDFPQICVPWLFGQTQRTNVVKVKDQFLWNLVAELTGIESLLLRMNHLYFLISIVSLKAIPWQRAKEETDEDIAQGFQIIGAVSSYVGQCQSCSVMEKTRGVVPPPT